MTDFDSASIFILLGACLVMLVFVVVLIFRVSWRLGKIEYLITGNDDSMPSREQETNGPSGGQGGVFETFLAEDPARRRLTKGEQATAYRRWRQEKGMNWSKP